MMNSNVQAYLRTKVMTANPAELRLMLIDGASRFAEQCRRGLSERDFEQAFEGSRQCRAILTELLSGLNAEHDPVLCERLNGLYTFLISRMMEAMSERDPELIDKVLELLAYEAETWRMLVEKLANEQGAGAEAASTPVEGDPDRTPSGPQGGRLHLAG